MPKNGSVNAVTPMVTPATMVSPAPVPAKAAAALPGTVTTAPRMSRKPAMDWLGTYLPILGSRPQNRMTAMMPIISTPAVTGWGAPAVAEMIASTGAPPNNALTASARPE